MFSHYIGTLGSHRVEVALADLPYDYLRDFRNTVEQIREIADRKTKKKGDDELHRIRIQSDLVKGLREIQEHIKKSRPKTASRQCPHCGKMVNVGYRQGGIPFIGFLRRDKPKRHRKLRSYRGTLS